MTLQSLTMYNGTLPLSRWMWLITTPTFQPRFSRAALFLPFHIFFYNLIGLFVLRNARNQHWSGEHICIRLRVKPLDPESGSYERQCWRRGRRVLVCSKLLTVTCLVSCSSALDICCKIRENRNFRQTSQLAGSQKFGRSFAIWPWEPRKGSFPKKERKIPLLEPISKMPIYNQQIIEIMILFCNVFLENKKKNIVDKKKSILWKK